MPVALPSSRGTPAFPTAVAAPPPVTPPPDTTGRWGGATSPFNQLAAGQPVHADSARLMSLINGWVTQINLNLGSYTTGVWTVDGTTPTPDHWQPNSWFFDDVPTPTNFAKSTTGTEWYDVFIHAAANKMYAFLKCEPSVNGTYTYLDRSGVIYRLDGSLVYDNTRDYWGGRASGFSQGAGLIRRSEFLNGYIPHALVCFLAKDLISTGKVWPATVSDGTGGSDKVPMGTWIALDPSVDVDSLTYLEPAERPIARALQEYGMFVGDSTNPGSGACVLFFQDFTRGDGASGSNPYGNISPMSDLLLQQCRVLTPPPVVATDWRDTFSPTNPHK